MTADVHQVSGRDPHEVLDVPRGAHREQVIRAFRRKVRHGGHPDTGGDARAFEEIVRARDVLLEQAERSQSDRDHHRTSAATGAHPSAGPGRDHNQPGASTAHVRPDTSPPRETHKLAIVTVVLAALGPLLWPVAIVVGHLALSRIKRTGLGGGTVVPVVLLFLYILTLPILARILSLMLIP
ncbi:MAG TPA: hypothetical protein VFZ37_11765 [Jiangellaceae bacterium]